MEAVILWEKEKGFGKYPVDRTCVEKSVYISDRMDLTKQKIRRKLIVLANAINKKKTAGRREPYAAG